MFYKYLKNNKLIVLCLVTFLITYLFFPVNIFADFMQSTNYKIQTDSLNTGGNSSSSTTYKMNDSVGEISTGDSNSANYYMHAGYWQMGESYISISTPSDLNLTSVSGLSGGSSEGTMSWNVTTDNTAGYTMNIASTTYPALKSITDSLSDYVPAGSDPDYNFTNEDSASTFGFSPEGTDVISRFKDNGSNTCNTGEEETIGRCWDGLSTTPKEIASKASSNIPSGSDITVRFRAEIGANRIQTSGTYNVVVVATATTL